MDPGVILSKVGLTSEAPETESSSWKQEPRSSSWNWAAEKVRTKMEPDVSSLIAYYRVSTQNQGRSGLGLETQRKAVAAFAAAKGLEVMAEFSEIGTGKGSDALNRRP